MTIDEAIEILEITQSNLEDPPPRQFNLALLLGIEALKLVQQERLHWCTVGLSNLPSETKEPERR